MGSDLLKWISRALLLAAILSGMASLTSTSSISVGVLDSGIVSTTGRSLLQTKKPCGVDFEFMNYTGITSRCKGPTYPREECCDAFLRFACPHADSINDLSTNCAATMFSYLGLEGAYPAGLFANQCVGDRNGLLCPENYLTQSGVTPNCIHSSAAVLASSFLGFLLMLGVL